MSLFALDFITLGTFLLCIIYSLVSLETFNIFMVLLLAVYELVETAFSLLNLLFFFWVKIEVLKSCTYSNKLTEKD